MKPFRTAGYDQITAPAPLQTWRNRTKDQKRVGGRHGTWKGELDHHRAVSARMGNSRITLPSLKFLENDDD